MNHKRIFVLLICCLSLSLLASDWPQHLGPNRDGKVAAPGLFGEKITLEQLWQVPLGSGFSSIIAKDSVIYTMHAAGENDALSAFDRKSSKTIWSYAIAPAYIADENSKDGPLSTPALDDKHIFGLGPKGHLFAVNRADGKLIWQHHLVEDYKSKIPHWGFTCSPQLVGDLMIVQVGDEVDKSIAAFDKKTGELRWHRGSEQVKYQSPSLVNLLGKEQIVALTEKQVYGLEPATGKVLWEHPNAKGMQMIPVGKDQFLTNQNDGFALFKAKQSSEKLSVEQVWASEALALDFDMPVHHKGYLYGFKGKILTCLKVSDGSKQWQSRQKGRGMAILVGDHLVINSHDGKLRIVAANHESYQEKAQIQVFEKGGFIEPSFSQDTIYVRNYSHMAAIKVN